MAPGKRFVLRAAYQQLSETRDRRRFQPPGRLVDLGGRRLHLYEAGDGAPAVVIIPALNGNVLEWLHIVRELQHDTRIGVYDRAGAGWSDPPPRGRRTIEGMAADLYAMLGAAAIPPPYVVVGHSLGGVVARRFTADHSEQVRGLVLVESSHENRAIRLPWRTGPGTNLKYALRRQARILGARRLAATLGLMRELDADIAREVPPEYAGAARAIMLSSQNRRTQVAELLLATRLRGQPPDLGSLPLTAAQLHQIDLPGLAPHHWPGPRPRRAALTGRSRGSGRP